MGFFVSPGFAVQPAVALSYTSCCGGSSTALSLGVNFPIYLAHDWGHTGAFVSPGIGLNRSSGDGESNSQAFVGIAVGAKSKISGGASLAFGVRLDEFLSNNDNASATQIAGFIGVSVCLGRH